ncbi:hypothetical protein J8J14_00515 [Roseomonas sp. SSH11]|uniref:Uncharacterized protein n=1 Tax=Pararoseomonas baculiformis TaxID=2820812 RepID=A0ABS4A8P0_9PROT|nr:hypothetical protein [Pararoseomonas baculiformis]MBP0443246.1 hypothetical protein [Pararoseomonas baculiformis]
MSDKTQATETMTVGALIAELQKLDPSRPVALGIMLGGEDEEEGEIDIYGIDLIEEMEAEDGSPAYVIACDLRGADDEEEGA